jgi:hypothetical protein
MWAIVRTALAGHQVALPDDAAGGCTAAPAKP